MKKFLYFIALFFLLVLGVTFTLKNPQSVSLEYYFGLSWKGPLVVVVLASILIGIILGYLSVVARTLKLRQVNSRLEKSNKRLISNNHSKGPFNKRI